MSDTNLRVGFGGQDITPPVGLAMCGSLEPRTNVGIDDPLMAKAMVVESAGKKIAVVGVELIWIPRSIADPAIAEASRRTGISPDAILYSCSHTHSGPYTIEGIYSWGVTNAEYLASLPGLLADAVERANDALQPATMSLGRSLVYHGLHHRRVTLKDGKAMNTWMSGALNDLSVVPQVVGSAGVIDPEMWVARFDDPQGRVIGTYINFSLHVNTHFGIKYSADYPGVIAEFVAKEYGPQAMSVFTPGACANINRSWSGTWREGAEWLASQAIDAARRARRVEGPIAVDYVRREVTVPRRDPESQTSEAINRLWWGNRGSRADVFDKQVEHMREMPAERVVPISAVRIGPLGIATNAGEYFVEHGLSIKRRSPFPHTVVAQLTNDLVMYQPTREALAQGGYEALVGPNRVAIEGIEKMTDTAVECLEELWAR